MDYNFHSDQMIKKKRTMWRHTKHVNNRNLSIKLNKKKKTSPENVIAKNTHSLMKNYLNETNENRDWIIKF